MTHKEISNFEPKKQKIEVKITLGSITISESTSLSSEYRLKSALIDFVERVSKGQTTSETEVAVLPEVAKVLLDLL